MLSYLPAVLLGVASWQARQPVEEQKAHGGSCPHFGLFLRNCVCCEIPGPSVLFPPTHTYTHTPHIAPPIPPALASIPSSYLQIKGLHPQSALSLTLGEVDGLDVCFRSLGSVSIVFLGYHSDTCCRQAVPMRSRSVSCPRRPQTRANALSPHSVSSRNPGLQGTQLTGTHRTTGLLVQCVLYRKGLP